MARHEKIRSVGGPVGVAAACSVAGAAALAVASLSMTSCIPTAFSDLQNAVWVDVETLPDGITASDYGAAMISIPREAGTPQVADGMALAIVDRDAFSTMGYDSAGTTPPIISTTKKDLSATIGTFDASSPHFLSHIQIALDPTATTTSARVAFGVETNDTDADGYSAILVIDALTPSMLSAFEFDKNSSANSSRLRMNSVVFGDHYRFFAARQNSIMAVDTTPPLFMPAYSLCNIPMLDNGSGTPVAQEAFGTAFANLASFFDGNGDFYPDLVSDAPGKTLFVTSAANPMASMADTAELTGPSMGHLFVVTGGFVADSMISAPIPVTDCETAQGVDVPVLVGPGTQILIANFGSGDRAVVMTPAPIGGGNGAISIVDFSTATPTVKSQMIADIASVAIGDVNDDGVPDFIVGEPTATVKGVVNAGQVEVYSADLSTVLMTLSSDITPIADERYGTAVALSPFSISGAPATNVISVSTTSALYTYDRTELYSDVRSGDHSLPK